MKPMSTFSRTILFFTGLLLIALLDSNAQEKIVFNEVIDWAWSPRQSLTYAGNGFYWWHRPNEGPGYITNYGQMPTNSWKTPYDYENGTFYLRFEIIEQPTSTPFTVQFGIWQNIGTNTEVVSALANLTGGAGSSVAKSIGSPANWHQVYNTDVDFTQPEDFYRIGFVLWKGNGSCIPMAQGWSNSAQCPNAETEQLNYFPMRARVTLVAVAAGRTFSGWNNYPPPQGGGTKPPIPTYSIDYVNELTNKVIPSTDEYAYNTSMTGAISGNSNKLLVTPGQNVYFRTKASGENPASDIQALNVPVRPAAPVFTYDPANERTSTIVSATYEYAFSPEMNSAVTGTNNYVTYPAGTTCYFRQKATSTSFSSAIQALTGTSYIPPDSCSGYTTHYWKLDENGSAYLYDYAGSLDANVVVAPTRVNGIVDYAQDFDGSAEASIPDDGSFDWNAGSSFSIEWWMNKSSNCA
ncbi:MAG: hypothetical protein JXB00_20220, partial [Bacteroidales bacterium]|nr:hypothetical protein [Bacteroidales bacterium]